MNKTKILGILVGLMALINLSLLMFVMRGKPQRPGPERFKEKDKAEQFIQKQFGFDEEQMHQFKKSKANHMQNAKKYELELENLSRSFYMVDSAGNSLKRDSLMAQINKLSTDIYYNNAAHFDEVRSICRPNQRDEMKRFIASLLMNNGNGKWRNNPRER